MAQYLASKLGAPPHLVFAKIPPISMKQQHLRGREEFYALRDNGRGENFLDM